MLGYLNRKLGNLNVAAKLALGFAVVLLLTLATTISGWRALDGAINRSQQLSEIGQINDLVKDLRAERITFRVLSDDTSKARIQQAIEQLERMLSTLQQRSNVDESRQLLTQKLQLLQQLREDFTELQSTVASRTALRQAMQAQALKLDDVIDDLQTQALLTMSESQQGSALGLMESLGRHVEGANQQSLVPAYTFSPVEAFAKVGDEALDAADKSLEQLLKALAPLSLPRSLTEQPGVELAKYRASLDQYRRAAVRAEQLQGSMEKMGDELGVASVELAGRKVEQRDSEALAARSLLTSVALLAMVLGVIAAWLITLQITQPLRQTLAVAVRIAKGDLSQVDTVQRRDEMGQLQTSMREMTLSLRELIGGIDQGVGQLSQAATQLATSSEDTKLRINQQREETDQVATAMNQMSATVQEVAQNAEQASLAATNADQQAQLGDQVVAEAIGRIEQLAGQMDHCLTAMQHLAGESQRIGSILDVIKSVSEQTNLLALNAAIEAARAGEAGRGFAVVADEVRGLAQRTSTATEEIGQLIDSLHNGTDEVTRLLDSSKNLTEQSVELSRRVGDALSQITDTVSSIQGMNQQIATASEEQSVVAEQINRSVISVRDASDQTSAASEQTAASSGELEQLGQQLRGMVGRFSI
ncbi:methyl-accepting chemotaxis protein [Pseudomonas monteilii]|jgi:methyl-accepting chemotaxis protein|uniref:Methyl-accepting chemotaxis protein n=1 Tax=Pseudomonas putida TaxID=303 RepID=A0A7U6LXN8_PSEPU|nr:MULTISPECIES: methyl-accepting chemotaxis protein [Pseudomonas]MBB3269373.1 methyl-accepting chemotaxis protein [Pseudomonas sp. OG7]MBH3393002.1 methyl-accepting chemotaxis protein [Pseudomonas monteilii]MBH3453213.1 methyl-accepting chemotaxis protein [Pseudomonas monteilii]MCJ7849990.1 methyl-accepting chemotaxis protein [Pseudomonas monteilii]MDD2126435.1 methyl-accepting chemotaxis protein [Pseudomonas monteilii]